MPTVFTEFSETVAELLVSGDDSRVAIEQDGDLFFIGEPGKPVFCLERPYPDDAWGVYHEASAAFVGDCWGDERGESWLRGSRASRGIGLLPELPPGDYIIVRSGLKPRQPNVLLLGNELVERPVWGAELLADDDLHVNVFGADPDRRPTLDQPLLGIPILNMANRLTGIFFLEMASPAIRESGEAASDLVLVIPRTGSLVLNTLEAFSGDEHRSALHRWAHGGARAAASRLARAS